VAELEIRWVNPPTHIGGYTLTRSRRRKAAELIGPVDQSADSRRPLPIGWRDSPAFQWQPRSRPRKIGQGL